MAAPTAASTVAPDGEVLPFAAMKRKLCVVTGANSGIGKAMATALARDGAEVVRRRGLASMGRASASMVGLS